MKITDEIIDDLIEAAHNILHHDGYSSKDEENYTYKNLRDLFGKILKHKYKGVPKEGVKKCIV